MSLNKVIKLGARFEGKLRKLADDDNDKILFLDQTVDLDSLQGSGIEITYKAGEQKHLNIIKNGPWLGDGGTINWTGKLYDEYQKELVNAKNTNNWDKYNQLEAQVWQKQYLYMLNKIKQVRDKDAQVKFMKAWQESLNISRAKHKSLLQGSGEANYTPISKEDQSNVFEYIKIYFPEWNTGPVDGKLGNLTRKAITKSKMQLKIYPLDKSTDQQLFDKLKKIKSVEM